MYLVIDSNKFVEYSKNLATLPNADCITDVIEEIIKTANYTEKKMKALEDSVKEYESQIETMEKMDDRARETMGERTLGDDPDSTDN